MVPSVPSAHGARTATYVVVLCLLTATCSPPPGRLAATADPSDAVTRVPMTVYRPVLNGFVSQRPVEPGPWREQNERVTPGQKQ